MSVIMEAEPEDKIYLISNVTVSPFGEMFSYSTAKDFIIGNYVFYEDSFKNKTSTQDFLSWFVKFKDSDGKEYAISQGYLVTENEWNDLYDFFQNK